MSDPSNSVKSAAEASEILLREVYAPNFFSKLASYGFTPATDRDSEFLFNIGNQLVQAEQLANVKEAEASTSFYETASNYLDQAMGMQSLHDGRAESARVKRAAAPYLNNHSVVEAAVALQDAAFAALQK